MDNDHDVGRVSGFLRVLIDDEAVNEALSPNKPNWSPTPFTTPHPCHRVSHIGLPTNTQTHVHAHLYARPDSHHDTGRNAREAGER